MTVKQLLEVMESYEEVQIRHECFDTLLYHGKSFQVPEEIEQLYVKLISCSTLSTELIIEACEPIDY